MFGVCTSGCSLGNATFRFGKVHINRMGNPRPDHWLSPGLVIKAQVQQNVARPNDETVSGKVLGQNSGLI